MIPLLHRWIPSHGTEFQKNIVDFFDQLFFYWVSILVIPLFSRKILHKDSKNEQKLIDMNCIDELSVLDNSIISDHVCQNNWVATSIRITLIENITDHWFSFSILKCFLFSSSLLCHLTLYCILNFRVILVLVKLVQIILIFWVIHLIKFFINYFPVYLSA